MVRAIQRQLSQYLGRYQRVIGQAINSKGKAALPARIWRLKRRGEWA